MQVSTSGRLLGEEVALEPQLEGLSGVRYEGGHGTRGGSKQALRPCTDHIGQHNDEMIGDRWMIEIDR